MNNQILGDLMVASNHAYNCTCDQCKSWWIQVGPDEDGKYGPFNSDEIQAGQTKTKLENYSDPYDQSKPCPFCGAQCEADFADIGIGMVQCGPYHCESCGAEEIIK